MRLYVASSWRNACYPDVLAALKAAGHECYDFRNPKPANEGFAWSAIDRQWQLWTPEMYRERVEHPLAKGGFALDWAALKWCEACVMIQPCGVSAALELGVAIGQGKPTAILLNAERFEPELMFLGARKLALTVDELLEWLATGGGEIEALPEPEIRGEIGETIADLSELELYARETAMAVAVDLGDRALEAEDLELDTRRAMAESLEEALGDFNAVCLGLHGVIRALAEDLEYLERLHVESIPGEARGKIAETRIDADGARVDGFRRMTIGERLAAPLAKRISQKPAGGAFHHYEASVRHWIAEAVDRRLLALVEAGGVFAPSLARGTALEEIRERIRRLRETGGAEAHFGDAAYAEGLNVAAEEDSERE